MPWRSSTPWMSSSQRTNASSHDTSRHVSPSRTIGWRRRSGSSCRCPRVVPFGHRYPFDQTSSRSPRISLTCPSSTSTCSPHMHSHSGHVTKCRCTSQLFHTTRGELRAGRQSHTIWNACVPNRAGLEPQGGSDGEEVACAGVGRRVTQLRHRPGLDLADALPGEVKVLPHLFERPRLAPVETEAEGEDLALALVERGQQL